jgi:GNAT superfamily N-acetyltransferase
MGGDVGILQGLRPGDLGAIVKLHGEYYHRYNGFDTTFEPYVAMPLSELVLRHSPKECVWVVESSGAVKGCIAIADNGGGLARLHWFLVDESLQGLGLGRRLIDSALHFAREQGYLAIVLWTVDLQDRAIHLYRQNGFVLVSEERQRLWGREMLQQCYRLELASVAASISTP